METQSRMRATSEHRTNHTNAHDNEMSLNMHEQKTTSNSVPRKDTVNIVILFLMYILQGIPLGLAGSIPAILANRHISYKEQALFSFVSWPFSVKLLWAPAVDSIYWKKIGRRKTWLVPTQYFIGIFMIVLSSSVTSLLGDGNTHPNVLMLTVVFFCMNFLAATQDIAVDGWALTMLSRRNVGYASVCNSVGQTTGYFLGNVVFLALESPEFCNKYLRSVPQTEGFVTLASFLKFWGVIFFIATSLILLFKHEKEERHAEILGIKDTYRQLYRILCLRNIWLIVTFLLTCKIAFAAPDSLSGLKLIEAGVKKENIALLAVPMVPVQIFLPLMISRYTTGPTPLSVFLKAYPYRLFFGVCFAVLVWWTHHVRMESGDFPIYYYVVIIAMFLMHQVTVYSIYVALMAFFAQVSDPAIGGTYMTLLNTICNLGGNYPTTLALWFVDNFTSKSCDNSAFDCSTQELALKCTEAGHKCVTLVDGYYVEVIVCSIFGILWLSWGRKVIHRLHQLPMSAWKCPR